MTKQNVQIQDVYRQVLTLYQAGQKEQAELVAQKMREQAPQHPFTLATWGFLYLQQQNFNAAVDVFRQVHEQLPNEPEFAFLYVQALRTNGQVREAHEVAQAVRARLGVHDKLLTVEGETKLFLGQAQQAVDLYAAYDELVSADFALSYYKMLALAANGQLDDAVAAARHAQSLQDKALDATTLAQFQFAAGVLLQQQGLVEEGQALHHQALKAAPHYVMPRLDSWQYYRKQATDETQILWSYGNTFDDAHAKSLEKGLNGEFGVRFGTTLRYLAHLDDQQQWHGFDSFEGLPESWNNEPAGAYTTQGHLPDMPNNVQLHVGWFEDTLPPFVTSHEGMPVRLLNIDCDIYSSTVTVLKELAERFVEGSVVVFDEYIVNKSWREDEFKAWQEFIERTGWSYEYLSFNFSTKQVAVRLTERKS